MDLIMINLDIVLTKGEVSLEKLSFRLDTINKMLDEKNIPFLMV